MMLNQLSSKNGLSFYQMLWGAASQYYRPFCIGTLKKRIKLIFAAYRNTATLDRFIGDMNTCKVEVTPTMLGMLEWPYIHNQWDVEAKFGAVTQHYQILSEAFPKLIGLSEANYYELADLGAFSPNIKVIIDHAPWFIREGELVINLFQGDLRVASMAFSLGNLHGDVVAYIGAVQGIHSGVPTEQSLEIYKQLTKDFEGLRPRSLLLEVLKMVAAQLGVKRLFAISEPHRHHRHRYFSHDDKTVFKNDYNVFWEEHEGELDTSSGFYVLPTKLAIRDMADIPSKKRSMYKRRYEILESIQAQISLERAR